MKKTTKRAIYASTLATRVLSVAVVCAMAACGSGSGFLPEIPGITTALTPTAKDEVEDLKNYMDDYYLWYKEIPAADLTGVTTAEEALKKLVVLPKDKYSYIDTQANQNAFFQEGISVGAGFGMTEVNGKVFINYVRPGSPAEKAGLKRADQLLVANGATITDLKSTDTPIGPREVGVKLDMTVLRNGQNVNLTMVKDKYPIVTVSDSTVLNVGGRKIGYLYFFAFIERTAADWASTIASLRAQGAQDLIVDLRHNGGGYLNTAGEIAGSLRTTAQTTAEVLATLTFNDKHTKENTRTALSANNGARFGKVAFLTTAASCSASEALINGLAPYQQTIVIGTTSCGKPVGFTPLNYKTTKVFAIVDFALLNRDGKGDYFDGLTPTCTVKEELTTGLGDPAEPLLAAATKYLTTGTCPVANSATTTKGVAQTSTEIYGKSVGVNSQWGLY
jgi:carboxyl-terminal processing protease